MDPLLDNLMAVVEMKNSGELYWKITDSDGSVFLIRWKTRNSNPFSPSKRKIHFQGKLIGYIKLKLGISGFDSRIVVKGDEETGRYRLQGGERY